MYLPSYIECKEIVKKNPHGCFYEIVYNIDNYKISIFSYRTALYNNFFLPIIENPEIKAFEMKGLSFVFNDDGSIFDRNLMLHKFWILDQYYHSKYDIFKVKKIKNITIKEDGFLVTFIKLPSGEIISQLKTGFDSIENRVANSYLDNLDYFSFISDCLNNNRQPIFELIHKDMIVGHNGRKELILLKIRDKITGKYLDIKNSKVKVVDCVDYTFDEIISLSKIKEDMEGWVVHFEDDSMVKIKTDWWVRKKLSCYPK